MPHVTESYLDHLGGDEADAAGPARRGLVQDVVDAEALVLGGEGVEVLLEQNVLLGDVGEDEVDLGAVAGRLAAADDGLDDLQHGRDARAAGDHAKVTHHVGLVGEGALGPAHADRLAHGEGREVLADVARGVRLDEEVKVARLLVARDGRVRAHDFLVLTVGLGQHGADGDVLADGEAEDVGRAGQGEAVAGENECVSNRWPPRFRFSVLGPKTRQGGLTWRCYGTEWSSL